MAGSDDGRREDEFRAVLARARVGDHRAFEFLVALVERPLLGFLRARGAADADAAANEVLIRAFEGIGRFDGDISGFRAWVFTIGRRVAIDEFRRSQRRVETTSLDGTTLGESDAGSRSWEHPPLDRFDEVERAERILAELTDDQREVIVLRVIAGLSAEETAQVLGRRPGAVRAIQHRALKRLRRKFSRIP